MISVMKPLDNNLSEKRLGLFKFDINFPCVINVPFKPTVHSLLRFRLQLQIRYHYDAKRLLQNVLK